VLDYVQQMMAWLLFLRPPGRLLQLGLGAGALTRFCLRYCPPTRLTAVELSEEVIDTARQWFALPDDGPRLSVVRDDADRFLAGARRPAAFGVVQVDLYDMHARGPTIDSAAFYARCAQALAAPGVCVVNLFGDHPAYRRSLRRLSEAFAGRVLELPPTAAGNRVVLAFKGPPLAARWPDLLRRAEVLRETTGLPAVRWVRGLRRRVGGGVLAV
jgi:spermidine synthase